MLEPKFFWFVANNPGLVDRMAPTIVAIARAMIARGVPKDDLDYALELTMSSRSAREAGLQEALMRELLGSGASATRAAVVCAAAYRECDALRVLRAMGVRSTRRSRRRSATSRRPRGLLATADANGIQTAFGLAVINGHVAAASAALDVGASIDAPLAVHAHATALHQAAGDDDVAMIELLLAPGRVHELRDRLWDATPLDWARHLDRPAARARLERASST